MVPGELEPRAAWTASLFPQIEGPQRRTVSAKNLPLFCPRCRKARQPLASFMTATCRECGEGLIAQGYCPVCESFWPLAAGTLCPKHDIELEAEPPPRIRADAAEAPFRWVTVGRFSDASAAQAPRIRLESEGIPTFLEGERMGSRSMYSVATGGALLKVPEHLAADARILLSQTWSATAAALDIDEWDDEETDDPQSLGDDLPDRAPAIEAETDSLTPRGGLLLFLLVLPGAILLYLLLRNGGVEP